MTAFHWPDALKEKAAFAASKHGDQRVGAVVLSAVEPEVVELLAALTGCWKMLDMLDPNCREYDEAERLLVRWKGDGQ